MAKKDSNKSDEDKKKKQEQLSRQKEKEKKKKERLEKLKKKQEKEKKRIKGIISFPFKALFQISFISGIITFVVSHFGNGKDVNKSLINSFLVFASLYFGIGLIMIAIFYFIAENKKKEMEEKKRAEEEKKLAEDSKRKEELARIEEDMRQSELRRKEELRKFRENNMNNEPKNPTIESESEPNFFFDDITGMN